ncbi:hypothetical protein ACQ4N7_13805 [Nodosilinea sp. AN01ver1]|uniref:hypothetical protein n=1 Tax=Nodosilinea sp. AN01ver1 TaxID=3423362 RepID=UPI003D322D20
MNRTDQISSILNQRRPLAEQIQTIEVNLQNLTATLQYLDTHRQSLLSKLGESPAAGSLREIDFTVVQEEIKREVQALDKLKARFSRNTLNIGVVGRARQGKSRLLQSLTGLSSSEIPDGDRQHCTGVRSTIHHNPDVEPYGDVWFYTDSSFLEDVISPYYDKLKLGAKPLNLETFARQPIPPLPKDFEGRAVEGAMYEHLKKYHANFDKYSSLLKAPSPKRISREQIREYVAQDTPDGKRIYFNYLAVKEVKITCNFPNEDVGQVALVDMPGLGDTGIGDTERLVKTLGQDVDIVLFVRMPKPSGDYWADYDVHLYDTVQGALVDLPISLWSFLVLNRTAMGSKYGDNWENCLELKESLNEKHIEVAGQLITNCADIQETSSLLDLILNYMTEGIHTLDRKYASACQNRLYELHRSVEIELAKARTALGESGSGEDWFPLFLQLFESLWDDLASGLDDLLDELRDQKDFPDMDFKQKVDEALNAGKQDTGLPSIEAIELKQKGLGGYPNAYYSYMNEVRAHLSQQFLLVDEALKRGLERVKSQVASVLMIQGRLNSLAEDDGTEFLRVITDQIPKQLIPNQESKLKHGFSILADFALSYRGLVQHRIRQHLDDLTPNTTELHLSPSPTAHEVSDCLTTLHSEALYKCRTALDDLLAEPSQAAFAIVEEFCDRVLRAEGVKMEWQIFLQSIRSEIWSDHFRALDEKTRTRVEWLNAIEKSAKANKFENLQFLN